MSEVMPRTTRATCGTHAIATRTTISPSFGPRSETKRRTKTICGNARMTSMPRISRSSAIVPAVRGEQPDRRADRDAERGGGEGHPENAPPSPQDAGEHIVAEVVGAEQELSRTGCCAGRPTTASGSWGATKGPIEREQDDEDLGARARRGLCPYLQRAAQRPQASRARRPAPRVSADDLRPSSLAPGPQSRDEQYREQVGHEVDDDVDGRQAAARSPGRPEDHGPPLPW